jgi:uncharacterized protein (DUF433 family)
MKIDQDIIDEYNSGATQKQLAYLYSISKQKVSKILKKVGINQKRKFTQTEIYLMLSSNLSRKELALELNIPHKELNALISYYRKKYNG